jgi:hypothetical protein
MPVFSAVDVASFVVVLRHLTPPHLVEDGWTVAVLADPRRDDPEA